MARPRTPKELTPLARRMMARLDELGMNEHEASVKAGLGKDGLRNITRGTSKNPTLKTLEKVATVLRWTVDQLTGSAPTAEATAVPTSAPADGLHPPADLGNPIRSEPIPLPAIGTMPVNLPVMGLAIGGPGDADFQLNGQVVDYVRRPPGLAHVHNAFAVSVVGSSMSPRFEEGELVFINPARVPRIGDDVVCELWPKSNGETPDEPGPAYIKRLVRKSSDVITFSQFNPALELKIETRLIKKLYRIMTSGELLGI